MTTAYPVIPPTPEAELNKRINAFQTKLADNGVDGALIIEKVNFYYYSGTTQQGWLYIPQEGEPVLMVFKEFSRAKEDSSLKNIISLASSKKISEMISEAGLPYPLKLGMELDVLPVTIFNQYQKIFAQSEIVDISLATRLQRAVKSDYEQDLIRAAVHCSDRMAEYAKTIIKPGKTEIEIAGLYEGHARSIGHQGLMRMRLFNNGMSFGHLMCGPGAAIPSFVASPNGGAGANRFVSQGASYNIIERDQPILLDYAFGLNGYISDHTRTFCIGNLDAELVRAHEVMRTIQERAKKIALPGALTGEIYDELTAMAKSSGFGEYFMGAGERKIRFIGHGVGIELDDFPFIALNQKLPLQAGMVFALEPKVIIPGKGMVGVENTHIVTESGLETLGKFPDEICYIKE